MIAEFGGWLLFPREDNKSNKSSGGYPRIGIIQNKYLH